MTKKDLTKELCNRTYLSRENAADVVDNLLAILNETMANGESIYFRGLGTFKVVKRAAKTGRNIKAGTSLFIPERKAIKFIPCRTLKDSLNG